ncbi:GlxA family transcriptional regulator [Nocardia sp. NPDC003482]
MHKVAILATEGVIPFDLSAPLEVFSRARFADGSPGYEVTVCGPRPAVSAGRFTLADLGPLDLLADADTIVLPGSENIDPPPEFVLDALRAAAARGARLASICVGAFTLAATGLLDGKRATTHWIGADLLAARYPRVRVDPRPLFIDEGSVLTSAGAAAGLDLCLHLVNLDYGAAAAADAARLAVVPLRREGGQAQFINHLTEVDDRQPFADTLMWLRDNYRRELTLTDIAAHAGVSTRTLNRRFTEQVGATPITYLRTLRVRKAKELLEHTGLPVERVAREVGFTSMTTFRDTFRDLAGVTPTGYRAAFRARRDQN